MGRVERRQYRRRQTQATAARALLILSAVVIVCGLLSRVRDGGLRVTPVAAPTPTAVASAYDETEVTREVTLPDETWYAIQTGVYTSEEAAVTRASAYADRGAPGAVVHEGDKYRVFIACFGDKADAQAVRTRLGDRQGVETYLYAWSCAPLTLRLSGMTGQVDVAEAGLGLCLNAAVQLRDAAGALDQGGMTTDEVIAVLTAQEDQLAAWQSAVQDRFDRPYPPLLQAELGLTDAWRNEARMIRDAARQGVTALSAQVKCSAIRLFAQVIDMRAGLTDS